MSSRNDKDVKMPDQHEESRDPNVPIITTKWEMMFHIFRSAAQAHEDQDHDKGNRLAASLLQQDDCPMVVAAGCHRIMAAAPGTHQGQLLHARISLEIYEECIQDMAPGPDRDTIQKSLDEAREIVAIAEARVENEEPQYYTDAEWEKHLVESFDLKKNWPEYFQSDEKDEKQKDAHGLEGVPSGTQTSTQSTKRS